MDIWIDSQKPDGLDRLDYNHDLTQKLRSVSAQSNIPHICLYGPAGSGKRTRVAALLKSIFGDGVRKKKMEYRVFKRNSTSCLEINVTSSVHHIELTPSDVGVNDRDVIQELIKQTAQNHSIQTFSKHHPPFKVVVLYDAHDLTKDAQNALRRTMERYNTFCRLILVCNSIGKLIDPLRSRCLLLRVGKPSIDDVRGVLSGIAREKGVDGGMVEFISENCDRNMRRAIMMLQANHAKPGMDFMDWEKCIDKTSQLILERQTPQQLLLVRSKIFELLTSCVSAENIFVNLMHALLRDTRCAQKKRVVVSVCAEYEPFLYAGTKSIFSLEAFVANLMFKLRQLA